MLFQHSFGIGRYHVRDIFDVKERQVLQPQRRCGAGNEGDAQAAEVEQHAVVPGDGHDLDAGGLGAHISAESCR
jgi:hypothetical protein